MGWLDWEPLLDDLLADLRDDRRADRISGQAQARCAWRFHQAISSALAALLRRAATSRACRQVVLAGGCFQNRLLLELLVAELRGSGPPTSGLHNCLPQDSEVRSNQLRDNELHPYWAERLPSNDGGLALGQLWAARLGLSITAAQPSEREARDVPGNQRSHPGHLPPPADGA